jgi:acyl carrier protein
MNDTDKIIQTEEVEKKIREVILSVSGKKIAPDVDGLQHLGLDSLDKLEVMTILESVFEVSFTEEVAQQFTSISSIARIVRRTQNVGRKNWQLSL